MPSRKVKSKARSGQRVHQRSITDLMDALQLSPTKAHQPGSKQKQPELHSYGTGGVQSPVKKQKQLPVFYSREPGIVQTGDVKRRGEWFRATEFAGVMANKRRLQEVPLSPQVNKLGNLQVAASKEFVRVKHKRFELDVPPYIVVEGQRYDKGDVIGAGAFGMVLGYGDDVVLKIQIEDVNQHNAWEEAQLAAEIEKRSCENVVGFYGAVRRGPLVFIAMKRMETTLQAWLYNNHENPPSFIQIQTLLRDVVNGLKCIHAAGFSYNDLKPDNVLLYTDTYGKTQLKRAKLGDLGCIGKLGTPAPCQAKYLKPQDIGRHGVTSENSDTFGVGLLGVDIITGVPYGGVHMLANNMVPSAIISQTLRQSGHLSDPEKAVLREFLRSALPETNERNDVNALLNSKLLQAPPLLTGGYSSHYFGILKKKQYVVN